MAREILLSLKAQLRVPIAVFFSIFFPIIMMIMMMTSYGNFSLRNGYHFIDKYFFISTTIGILPLTLISFPIDINNLLETKHYLRLKYLNVDLKKLFLSNIISYLIILFISVGINLIVGKSIYNLRLPSIEYLCYFFIQLFYCAIVLLIFGLLLSLIVSDIKALMPVGMTIMFILFMVIGVFVQYSSLPKIIRTISSYIPVKYLANDFYYIWIGQAKWNMPFFKCNTIWLIFLCLICYIIYRRKNNVTKIFN